MIFKNRQRGQALVLIALAAVALFAFAALAIDGSRVFSDRRHSQNASDTAAYAAALAKVRGKALLVWKQAGKDLAETNGYKDDGVNMVWVYTCEEWLIAPENPTHEPCKGLPGSAIESEYVYVRIKSVVPLFFAKIIGWSAMTNYTDAVVHASPPKVVPWYDGNALVSTMTGCPPTGYPHDPFTVTGHSGTTVVSAGILVNSNCAFPDAYDQGGSSHVTVDPDKHVCVIGDAESTNTSPSPDHDCTPIDPEIYVLPETPSCSGDGEILENAPKDYTATPGNYNSPFPNKSPAGNLKLLPGIYCLNKGISLNSSWFITTDLDGDGHDIDSEGVFFYVPDGDVTFNGSSEIHIHAISAQWPGLDQMYVNMFMYVPPENNAVITITGSDGSSFTGTILAPTSHVKLSGGSTTSGGATDGTVTLDAQIIGYSVAISGNGTLNILYTQSNNATGLTKPLMSMKE